MEGHITVKCPVNEVLIVVGIVLWAYILPQLVVNATVHGDYRSFEKWKASLLKDHRVYSLPIEAGTSDIQQ